MKKLILMMVLLSSLVYSQELGRWRWANMNMTGNDKIGHFVGTASLYAGLHIPLMRINEFDIQILTITLAVAKEVKDALVPYEQYGKAGGEGFSFPDVIYDVFGMLIINNIRLKLSGQDYGNYPEHLIM